MDFVAIDFETANETRRSACSLGIAFVENGQITRTWHSLIRPSELRFSTWNSGIHGIPEEDIRNARQLCEVWSEIQGFIDGQLVVAHNASFDISVLRHSLHANGIATPSFPYLCSYQLARIQWSDELCFRLSYLAERFDIPLEHHNAESDAVACAKLVLLAANQSEIDCPFELARSKSIQIGYVQSHEEWIPSRTVGVFQNRAKFSLDIPQDFDLTCHPLHGKNVVFTGTLSFCSRKDAEEAVVKLGGHPKDSVNKKTDYVFTGYQDLKQLASNQTESRKLRLAKALREEGCKVQILTDHDFREMVFCSIQQTTPAMLPQQH